MSAYKVATTREGARVWWVCWQLPHGLPNHTDVRDAFDDESALMDKVVWDKDTSADLDKLKELIQRT